MILTQIIFAICGRPEWVCYFPIVHPASRSGLQQTHGSSHSDLCYGHVQEYARLHFEALKRQLLTSVHSNFMD